MFKNLLESKTNAMGRQEEMGGKMTNMGITTLDAKYSLKYPLFISPKTIKIDPISKVSFISPA